MEGRKSQKREWGRSRKIRKTRGKTYEQEKKMLRSWKKQKENGKIWKNRKRMKG